MVEPNISGRTLRIISRFPHFYPPEDPNSFFFQLLNIFGESLEQVEEDLMAVLRSHFVDTASNFGSQGFTAKQKGDLDRLFSLYLENLGGTSQLSQISQDFQTSDINQLSQFVNELVASHQENTKPENPVSCYLWQRFSQEIQELLKAYQVENANLNKSICSQPQLVQQWKERRDAFTYYLQTNKFSEQTTRLLANYNPTNPVNNELSDILKIDLNQSLNDPTLIQRWQEYQIQIHLLNYLIFSSIYSQLLTYQKQFRLAGRETVASLDEFVKNCIFYWYHHLENDEIGSEFNRPDASLNTKTLSTALQKLQQTINANRGKYGLESRGKIQQQLESCLTVFNTFIETLGFKRAAQTLYRLLPLKVQRYLEDFPAYSSLPNTHKTDFHSPIQAQLLDPKFCQRLLAQFKKPEPYNLNLFSEQWRRDLLEIALKSLLEIFALPTDNFPQWLNVIQSHLSQQAQIIHSQGAKGDNLKRLNRLILEAVYHSALPKSNIPSPEEVSKKLSASLNDVIQCQNSATKTSDLYIKNSSFFESHLLPAEAKFLLSEIKKSSPPNPKQVTRLNRLLLDIAYPLYLKKSDTPYRERLKYLISVLQDGPATYEGIINIVAANLGMCRTPENEVNPWESFCCELPLELEAALHQFIASAELQQAFKERGIALTFNTTVAVEEREKRWLVSDTTKAQVYVVRKQNNCLSVHRQLIRIVEYSPNSHSETKTISPTQAFVISNENYVPTPLTVTLQLLDNRSINERNSPLPPLSRLRLVEEVTGDFIECECLLQCNDTLSILADGSVLLNGEVSQQTTTAGKLPMLPVQKSRWYIQGEIGSKTAFFAGESAQAQFDFSSFDVGQKTVIGRKIERQVTQKQQKEALIDSVGQPAILDDPNSKFDGCSFDQAEIINTEEDSETDKLYKLSINFRFIRLTPGTFNVIIPWHIPQYTDRFDETPDHPRHQISGIIEKVRAAGVHSSITYEQEFRETHEISEKLHIHATCKVSQEPTNHDINDRFLVQATHKVSEQPTEHDISDNLRVEGSGKFAGQPIDHEISDRLTISLHRYSLAIFDTGTFDSIYLASVADTAGKNKSPDFPLSPQQIGEQPITAAIFGKGKFDFLKFDFVADTAGKNKSPDSPLSPQQIGEQPITAAIFGKGKFDFLKFDFVADIAGENKSPDSHITYQNISQNPMKPAIFDSSHFDYTQVGPQLFDTSQSPTIEQKIAVFDQTYFGFSVL